MTYRLEVTQRALSDLDYWINTDRKMAKKIMSLLDAVVKNPCDGIGKPEPLKNNLSGYWSRRIDKEHRLI